ncbi:MAG: type II secretion system F family protein [Gaiellaceae bacterium]
MPMLLIFAAVSLSLSALCVGNLVTLPARHRRTRIRTAATYGNVRVSAGPERAKFRERVVSPFVTWLARTMLRLNARQSLETLSTLLTSAGMRDTSAQTFLAAKGISAGGGVLLGIVLGAFSSVTAVVLFAGILGAIGYIAPSIVVSQRAKRRQSTIVSQLPDALDLLTVSVEAGLGFDAAVAKLTQYMTGPLSEEFDLALGEMRIGEGRSDALKKLAVRAGTPEVSAFVRSIVQADQLGTSLGRILRVQATDTRVKRQAAAEERAMKAPIKMLFPTVAFIFPAMFIVILGPAMLSLGKLFGF